MNLWYNASFSNMNEVTLLLKNPGDMAFTFDVVARQILPEHPGQLVEPGFAGPVRIVVPGARLLCRYRGRVDNTRATICRGAKSEERQQLLCDEEHRLEIQVEHRVPVAFRELFERGLGLGACIVDKDVEGALPVRKFLRQSVDADGRREIAGEKDTFSRVLAEALRRLVEVAARAPNDRWQSQPRRFATRSTARTWSTDFRRPQGSPSAS